MPSLLTRTLLFLSSYSPLFMILAIRNWETRWIATSLVALAGCSVLWLVAFLHHARNLAGVAIRVARATPRDGDIVSYVVSYLLPFLAVDFARPADVASLSVLLAVIALLYVHSNLIYVNPLLAALGYHLTEVEEDNGKMSILLSRRRYLRPGAQLRVVLVGDLVTIEVAE